MHNFEIEILKNIENLRTDLFNILFEGITMLGEETPIILLIAILYFAFNKKAAQKLFFIVILSLSSNSIIKNLVKRVRPFMTSEVTCIRPETATGYSFPSGHTQNFATWSMALVLNSKNLLIEIIALILIILVAFSRMYLGVHYASDVIVGGILGITFAILGSKLYDKVEDKNKLFGILAIFLTPFAVFFMINSELLYEDFYKLYGMTIGFFYAVKIEEKYAPIDYDSIWWKKIIRVIVAIIVAFVIKESAKLINMTSIIQISFITDTICYFMLTFIIFGIWPIIIKKVKL